MYLVLDAFQLSSPCELGFPVPVPVLFKYILIPPLLDPIYFTTAYNLKVPFMTKMKKITHPKIYPCVLYSSWL